MGFESMPSTPDELNEAPPIENNGEKKEGAAESEYTTSPEEVLEGIAAHIKKYEEQGVKNQDAARDQIFKLYDLAIKAMKQKIPFDVDKVKAVFGDAANNKIIAEKLNSRFQRLSGLYKDYGEYQEYKWDMEGREIDY